MTGSDRTMSQRADGGRPIGRRRSRAAKCCGIRFVKKGPAETNRPLKDAPCGTAPAGVLVGGA
jgi:hypothetical protein